ncbi:GAF domain-containing sensor histidine kinase [Thermostichus vulcanus]|uniref:histidine kinase n=1 Tax=Thermostichus vulcanus str. 'Rupite' TaxID=2813851 RepID=A0ABT0CBB0_THEVL|nr:GAF domain-containing sensor histidine kinase [Thermostichus vulcanus]MCJ2543060.1 GAF domain-containing sensor histidine kinase [Thermostichus vulcanus str. 'Rupite']
MGSSLFCGVVGLTGLVLHWGSSFRVESARIAAPEARVQTVTAYEDLAWFYLMLLGISLGSSVWLLVLLDQQVLSRLQPSGSGLEEGSPTGQNQAQARSKSQQIQHLNAALEQQVQQQTAQLRQSLNYEATLKRITDKVRDSLEEDQILQTAVQELATSLELLGCDAALYNLELGISTITYEYGAGLPSKLKSTIDLDEQGGLYRRLLAGDPVLLCQVPPTRVRKLTKPLLCLACPIFDRFRSPDAFTERTQPNLFTACKTPPQELAIFGDLWLFKPIDQEFSESEIRLVQQVATQCAIGLRQARLYKALQSQVAQLESLHQLKDDFLNTISHELRTPMSNIKMSLYMIRKTQNEEQRQRYLDILETESNREIELINDLLDLQRLEAGVDQPLLEPVDLTRWIPAQLRSFEARIAHYQQTLQVELDPALESTEPQLWSDTQRLSRILGELINNACKYTAPGGAIHLRVASELGQIRFEITNPAQIPADQLPHLFKKFYRVPNGDPWNRGGTGLGLALVKKLVEQLGGKINVTSQAGLTTFWFVVPHHRSPSHPGSLAVSLPQP